MNLILFLIIGALAGYLAGLLMKGRGLGLLGNLVVGVLGSFLGGWVFPMLGVSFSGFIGSLIMATAGAVLLLFIIGVLKKT